MCDERNRLSIAWSAANTEAELLAANRALLDHLALCPECLERKMLELAAIKRLMEMLQHDDGALLAGEVAQS